MRISRCVLVLAALLAACGDDGTGARPPAAVAVQSGNGQAATAGQPVPNPLIVRVTDASGDPVRGATVAWAVTSGGGTLGATSSVTASDGLAQVQWTLGPRAGAQTVTAAIEGLPPVVFTIQAAAGAAGRLVIDRDSAEVSAVSVAQPFSASFTDGNGNPATPPLNATISWRSLDPAIARVAASDTPGQVNVYGVAGGRARIEASSGGLADTAVYLVRQVPNRVRIVVAGGQYLSAGDTTRLRAVVYDANNGVIENPVLTWTSTDPQGATVDQTGKVTFLRGDTLQIAATAGNARDAATFFVSALFRVTSLSAGGDHSCAVSLDGKAYCWGYNKAGQLGAANPPELRDIPVAVATPLRFATIAAAAWPDPVYQFSRFERTHSCAITSAGEMYCWGESAQGQVGSASYAGIVTLEVAGDRRWAWMSTGGRHTCAITVDGDTYCWGMNTEGQVGAATTDICSATTTSPPFSACTRLPTEVYGGRSFVRVSAGSAHSCALTQAGAAYCWGRNGSGQLGNGSTVGSGVPGAVAGAPAFVEIAAGGNHTCARTSDGAVFCWGENGAGQLGNGGTASSSLPVRVAGTYTSITAGWAHSCGLRAGGAAFCWGSNEQAQLGTGGTTASSTPVAVTGGTSFSAISTAGKHTCGIRAADGAALCWGSNEAGKLGYGTNFTPGVPRLVRAPD